MAFSPFAILKPFGPDPSTFFPPGVQIRVEALLAVDKWGKTAHRLTQSPAWTPHDTGHLMSSIFWSGAKWTGNAIEGTLGVDVDAYSGQKRGRTVPYARRQEFEHGISPFQKVRPSKAFYLLRAIKSIMPGFQNELKNSILRQWKGHGATGGHGGHRLAIGSVFLNP